MSSMGIDEATHLKHQQMLCRILEEFDRVCKVLAIPYTLFSGTLLGAVRHQGFIPWDDDVDIVMLREDYDRFMREAGSVLDQQKFYLQKEFSEHWPMFFSKLRMNGTACLEKFHPKDPLIHQGIYIDIFPCDNASKNYLGRLLQFLASKVVIAKCLYERSYDTDSWLKRGFIAVCKHLPMAPFLRIVKREQKAGELVHSFFGGASAFSKNVYPRAYFVQRTDAVFEGKFYPISQHYDKLLKTLYGDYMQIPAEEDREQKQHAILLDFENSYEKYQHYRDDMHFDVYTRSIR